MTTFEEATEGSNRDETDSVRGIEISPEQFDGETIEEIASQIETVMAPGPSVREEGETDFGGNPGSITIPSPGVGPIDIPNIELGDLGEFDLSFIDETDFTNAQEVRVAQFEILTIIAELLAKTVFQQQATAQFTQQIAGIGQANFEVNKRILRNAQPISRITISGTATIQDANSTTLVVPESDENSTPTRQLLIRSSVANTTRLFFGDDEVSPEAGFSLQPGEAQSLPIDLREEDLYVAADEANQVVELIGVI